MRKFWRRLVAGWTAPSLVWILVVIILVLGILWLLGIGPRISFGSR